MFNYKMEFIMVSQLLNYYLAPNFDLQPHSSKYETDRLILAVASQVESNILKSLHSENRITLRDMIKAYQGRADSPCSDKKMALFNSLKNYFTRKPDGAVKLIERAFNYIPDLLKGISLCQLKSELNHLNLQQWQTVNKTRNASRFIFNGFEFASIRHIKERHWAKANMGTPTSHFNDDMTVEKLRTLATHTIIYGNTTSSHDRFRHEYCFANPIGI